MVPKNTGLKRCKEIAESMFDNQTIIKEIRGEDIPFFIERSIQDNKKIIGITGEDLFKEYLLNARDSKLRILRRILWKDKSALFGKPVLCLLGSKDKTLEELPKRLKVCINRKYSKIAKKFLSRLQYRYGIIFEKFYFNGSTEETFISGLSDLVIEMVYTGGSAERAGLRIYEKIFESDIVIIGQDKETLLNK